MFLILKFNPWFGSRSGTRCNLYVILIRFYNLIRIKTAHLVLSFTCLLCEKKFVFFPLPPVICAIRFPPSPTFQSFSLFVNFLAAVCNCFLWRIVKKACSVIYWCGWCELWCFQSLFLPKWCFDALRIIGGKSFTYDIIFSLLVVVLVIYVLLYVCLSSLIVHFITRCA